MKMSSHFPWHLLLRQTCMMLIVYEMTLKQRSEITNAFILNIFSFLRTRFRKIQVIHMVYIITLQM